MSGFTVTEAARLSRASAPVLRAWDRSGVLVPERRQRASGFPGARIRLYDQEAVLAAMALAELRQKGVSSASIRKAGRLPRVGAAAFLVFECKAFRWHVTGYRSIAEIARRAAGPVCLVSLEENRRLLRAAVSRGASA